MERVPGFSVNQLFSRNGSPPLDSSSPSQQGQATSQYQQSQQHVSPAQSYREPPPASPPKSLDSLFRNMNPQASAPTDSTPQAGANNPFRAPPPPSNNSAPATPVSSVTVGSVSSGGSGGNPPADRASAILSSLLGSSSGTQSGPNTISSAIGTLPTAAAFVSQQSSSPPGMDQRSRPGASGNEAQGKILLEQLMSGNVGPSTYGDATQGSYTATAPVSYAPLPYGPQPSDSYQVRDGPYSTQDNSIDYSSPPAPASQPQPPSPSRKSMFDFVSPFDVLQSSSATKKPEPSLSASTDTYFSAAADPKRKSVENLMDQLTRGQGPLPASGFNYSPEPGSTPPPDPAQLQKEAQQSFLPKTGPTQLPGRSSPPRSYAQRLPQGRIGESPNVTPSTLANQTGVSSNGKDRSLSPSRANWKSGQESKAKGSAKPKTFINPAPQTQSIVVDVAQNLENIQASRDCVKSTAIALVRVEPTFLPGTTIGATHWVAYAMTRGRVRVISRSSGDRTLLQLPPVFGPAVSVTDMAVYGNRLAGVTSDGGFVVWELPEVITDDVPGNLLVCVIPAGEFESLHSVKWHPKDPDTVAVASDSNIYLMNVLDIANAFRGATITQGELSRASQVFSVQSPINSFDFDVAHQALATVTEDSLLTLWNTVDGSQFWSSKILGDGTPSSLTFLDGGVLIGRKNGTVFQLLPVMGDVVLSTVKFVNGNKEDPDMFGHVTYDRRIQTVWVANSRRDSLFAMKVCFELSTPSPGGEELIRGGYFEQVVEFVGPKPTIHFVILTADADPDGDEANAACVAAKLPPGELALVAFSVHSSGVDQVLIRKEWFESAFTSTATKFPPFNSSQTAQQRPVAQSTHTAIPPPTISQPIPSAPIRLRTPPSEEVEIEHKEESRVHDVKGKSTKGKNVGWKDKEDSGKDKEKNTKGGESSVLNESPLGIALAKEIRKVEENLHTRIGRLIAKELDKQHQRLEDTRANEQAADFVRQEKILKLISNELTKNTTRVVETAVKGEVHDSVLPSLETITRTEVKNAVATQLAKGLSDSVKQTLPPEIEKFLLKPDVSSQIARNLSNALNPLIDRQIKDLLSKTLIPSYQTQSNALLQELTREIQSEIGSLKKDIMGWQGEAIRAQESLIREMDQNIRALSEQIKFMSMNMPPAVSHVPPPLTSRTSPGASASQFVPGGQSPMGQSHHRANLPSIGPNYQQTFPPPPPASSLHSQWYSQALPPSHGPQTSGPPAPSQSIAQPKSEEWDDTYLAVLGTQDLKQLRELLARSNPEVIMPSNGVGPLSQAVILTLVHRLAAAIGETSPVDEAFKSSLWWLQRAASTLNTNDPLIAPYTGRVLPNVLSMLNTTKQRLNILPGGPQLAESARTINDVQEILSRKPM